MTVGLAVRVYVGDVVEAIGLKVDDVTGYVQSMSEMRWMER